MHQKVTSAGLVLATLATIILVALVERASSTKCYKDESVGDRDGNVYYCEESGRPRCCVEDSVPTCCKSESAKNLEEQLQLWGMVAAMIFVVVVVFICVKNDVACCTSETSVKERCANLCRKNKSEQLVEEDEPRTKGGYFDNPAGPRMAYGGNRPPHAYPSSRALDPYNFPPLPPITPSPGQHSSYA